MRRVALLALLAVGCGDDSAAVDAGTDTGRVDAAADSSVDSSTDSSVDTAVDAADAGPCDPVLCALACEFGFVRGADGCEICECNPAPDDSCTIDEDCVVARNVTGCCGCDQGHSQTRVESEVCLVERGETPVDGCLPDPAICAVIDCAACEPVVRAVCVDDVCTGSDECAPGEVTFRLSCVPSCESHANCTVAADYSQCCGGCEPVHRSFLAAEECWAERQSDTECAPPAGSCDDIDCPSPPTDCPGAFLSAVCMDDGTCRDGGPAGMCPEGFTDVDDVCVAD